MVLSGLRALGRQAMPRHGQRGRRDDRVDGCRPAWPRAKSLPRSTAAWRSSRFCRSAEHRERVRRELGYRPEHVVIGKIARLFKLKGHDDVIRAARSVVDAEPNVRFLFVGDGMLRDRLERQIAAAGLTDHFQFTGLVPPERIPELLAATDMVVHASLREGLARVLPQALIAGKPVVSYDVDGAREVVIPDETGFLVPPRDVEALAAALKRLVADPALARTGSAKRAAGVSPTSSATSG